MSTIMKDRDNELDLDRSDESKFRTSWSIAKLLEHGYTHYCRYCCKPQRERFDVCPDAGCRRRGGCLPI